MIQAKKCLSSDCCSISNVWWQWVPDRRAKMREGTPSPFVLCLYSGSFKFYSLLSLFSVSLLTPDVVFVIVPCVSSSYRWVHFSGAVLFRWAEHVVVVLMVLFLCVVCLVLAVVSSGAAVAFVCEEKVGEWISTYPTSYWAMTHIARVQNRITNPH